MDNQENTKGERVIETKPGRNWNGWDVFFIVAPLICIILVPLGGLGYLCGRLGFYMLDGFMLSFYIVCFIVFCIVYGFDRLFMYGKKYIPKKRFLITVEIVIPIVCILSCIAPFVIHFETFFSPPCKPYMYGIRDGLKSRTDISSIKDWLKTLDKEDIDYYKKNPYYFYSHSDELPESVKAIGRSVGFSTDQNGNLVLHSYFGRTFENWGVFIGAEDMEVPPTDCVARGGYWMYVEPGFYIVGW